MDKLNARKGLSLGNGKAQDTEIEVNNGATNKPKVKWNETTQKWQFSNNGVDFNDFGSGGAWGEITGTLSDQTDLQNALDAKLNSTDNLTDVADQQTALNNITAVSGAIDEYVLTKDTSTGNALWKEVISSDELLKVSANDTTAGYLEDKIVVVSGTNTTNVLEISTLNDGTDEDLQIQIDESKIDHDNLTGVDALGGGVTYGHISDGAETIYGIKTFDSFPLTPSLEPTTDYEVVNKKYVDDNTIPDSVADGNIYARRDNAWEQITTAVPSATIAKAWVNFNGTGTVAIRSSYNVSSITDNGTGNYTVNFINEMIDTNYSVSCTAGNLTMVSGNYGVHPYELNTTGFSITINTTAAAKIDLNLINAQVFGN